MAKNKQAVKAAPQAVKAQVVKETPKTEEKQRGFKKLTFAEGEVGVAYIAEQVGTTPFLVREYLRSNVRDMEQEKGHAYRFTLKQAAEIIEAMKAKASAPKKSSKKSADKKATKEKVVESVEVEDLEDLEAQLESLEDDSDDDSFETGDEDDEI